MKKSLADKPEFEGKQYHIDCKKGDLARYVLLPGDPERVLKIAKLWDNYREVAYHREYRSVTGKYHGVEISCTSTGIGSPSAAIALEELARIGVDTFLRVGSTGAIQDIPCGDLIINVGALRFEGTSKEYVFKQYPAFASYEVVLALIEACETMEYEYHLGVTASTDSFYLGQARLGFEDFWQSRYDKFIEDLRRARVTNFEMEASCIFTLAQIYGLRAGCICAVFANRVSGEFEKKGEEKAGLAATEAVKILHEWDTIKQKKGKKWFYPGLIK